MFLHFVKILKTNKIKGIIIMIPFILLIPILFLQYIPFVLTAIPDPYADYTVGRNAVVLNDLYIKSDGDKLIPINIYQHDYIFDQNSDNHILLPIYRALKIGTHLTNLGYNEGIWDTHNVDPKQDNTNDSSTGQVIASEFYRNDRLQRQTKNLKYKSLYTSSYNNTGNLIYNFISKNNKIIETQIQQQEVTKRLLSLRYAVALFHALTFILLLLVLYIYKQKTQALLLSIFMCASPIFFYIIMTTQSYFYIFIPQILYILIFLPRNFYESSLKDKMFFIIGFTFCVLIQQYLSGISGMLTSFGFSATLLCFLLIMQLLDNLKIQPFKKHIYLMIYPIILTLFIVISIFILYKTEMHEASVLWGGDISYASSMKKSFTFKRYPVNHFLSILYHNLSINKVILTQNLGMLFTFMKINISFSILHIIGLWLVVLGVLWKKFGSNVFIENWKKFRNFLLALVLWHSYLLLCIILSPWFMNHYYLYTPIFGFYYASIWILILGYTLDILFKQAKIVEKKPPSL